MKYKEKQKGEYQRKTDTKYNVDAVWDVIEICKNDNYGVEGYTTDTCYICPSCPIGLCLRPFSLITGFSSSFVSAFKNIL